MPISGRPLHSDIVPLQDLLRPGLDGAADGVALASADGTMTWREVDDSSTFLAQHYRELGLEPGDRIASLMPNRSALLTHYLACFKAGLVVTPLNYRYTGPEIDHALGVSEASAIVAHTERAEDLKASRLAADLRLGIISYGADESVGPTFEAMTSGPTPGIDLDMPDPSAPAAIFFTSGSTGPAKGVTHSAETLSHVFTIVVDAFELTPDDRFLPASSMSHIGSFMWAFGALSAGAQVVVAKTFDAGAILPLLRTHRPTLMSMVPAALAALVRDHGVTADDFSSLRVLRSGADHVAIELEEEFRRLGVDIDEGYGMTEVGLATQNPIAGPVKEGSIGPPVPGVSISIRTEDGTEAEVDEVGRVWINTPGCTLGYWENPDATAEVLQDGWLDSGDLVRRDGDGYLWFFGRKKQIIVHDGSNISPLEVEGALLEHPGVAMAGVVGIHDLVHGENVRAYVTVEDGHPTPTSQELIDFARTRVGYKSPEEVVVLDELPLNATGKIDRPALVRLADDHRNPHVATSSP